MKQAAVIMAAFVYNTAMLDRNCRGSRRPRLRPGGNGESRSSPVID